MLKFSQFRIVLTGFAAIAVLSVAPVATAQDGTGDPGFGELAYLAATDPTAAVSRVDLAIQNHQASGANDPRLTFDLIQLKADLLLELGRTKEAAPLLAALAGYAVQFRTILDIDPIPLLQKAANLYEQAGDIRAAVAQQKAILNEQRDGGQKGDILSATFLELARLSGQMNRPADAERFRTDATAALQVVKPTTRGDKKTGGFREVEVYYATDRAPSGDAQPSEYYGHGRGELELGIAIVTVPDIHEQGIVEAPSIWLLEFGPSAAKHVVLQSVTPVGEDAFYTRLQQEFAGRGKREAFVFIHGYNVRFDQAAKRAAQIAYDMNYAGVPVLYSWPSRGSTLGYIADTAVVRLSGRRLSLFLDDLVAKSGASTIHIVAHSMGNRALTDALELMALRHDLTEDSDPLFGQILFAAPDVDAGLFASMLQTIRPIAKRLTLYASNEDWALASSRKLHGNAPRAGQGGQYTLASNNIDSVDMSELGEDMLAHSYFADDSSALADMLALFWDNTSPKWRCGLVADEQDGTKPQTWRYELGECGNKNLISVLAHMQRENVTTASHARAVLARTVQDSAELGALEPIILRMVEN